MLNCVNQLFVRFNLLFLSILCSKQSILLYLLPFTKLSFMLFVFINYFYHVGDMGGLLLVLPSDVLNFMNNLWCPHLLEHIVHRRNRGQKTFFFCSQVCLLMFCLKWGIKSWFSSSSNRQNEEGAEPTKNHLFWSQCYKNYSIQFVECICIQIHKHFYVNFYLNKNS